MQRVLFTGLFLLLIFLEINVSAVETYIREDWKKYFDNGNTIGTIVILDRSNEKAIQNVYNQQRASKRFTPASTFKIPHTLFSLDAGIVKDEFEKFEWDGIQREVGIPRYDEIWNGPQTLQTGLKYSVVWFYQQLARQIGLKREHQYLKLLGYGNQEISNAIDDFWLDGSLQISALEQIEFLKKLYKNELPFNKEDQLLVKDLMISKANNKFKIRSKTGWAEPDNMEGIGWYVGWIEIDNRPVFFALNIEIKNGVKDLHKRVSIVENILKDLGII